ncbi:MAG: phenylalanine--tRNA ligase subunit alpha [Puniceicoccales bacterium]|jgi:phenylalanyl-tRNA synthetase alpha chain|nr:phenylalanine--tRNA ligase subunit alpha [Puniceicoccales bacterium]
MAENEEITRRLLDISDRWDAVESSIDSFARLEAAKAEIFGPSGSLTLLFRQINGLPTTDRPEWGKRLNAVRGELMAKIRAIGENLSEKDLKSRLGETVDPTLSLTHEKLGYRHPLSLVRDRVVSIFKKMGFSVAEATELETEWACFDALQMPETHPARDAMDTFFLPDDFVCGNVQKRGDEHFILRTHCTSVQIRALLCGQLPLKIIAPGRVFRRDTVDATHSANFHQCDVIHADKNMSVVDLKATIEFFLLEFFGSGVQMRYRPSFFPFTEPSFEVDIRVPNLGKLSGIWIEIFGCGMIHPGVFKAVGVDADAWSGQAWGIGIERLAMLAYGIDDIRHFYRNDFRFLRQFN